MQKKGVPEIQEVSSTQFSYEWFGLGFTGVGLPLLARRARVPADSATLYCAIARNLRQKTYTSKLFNPKSFLLSSDEK